MTGKLNYKHLRYFWAVAREGSVSGAARSLGMSAQTVSGQISRLEQTLGQALFTLEGRRLALTDAGRLALRYADTIFQLGEELEDSLQQGELTHSVRFTVGIADVVPKTVSCRLLAPAIEGRHPVRLRCLEGDFDDLLSDLALHRLDMVLTDRPVPSGAQQQFRSFLLARCPVMLFGAGELADRYREDFPGRLDGAPMLLPTRGNVLRSQLDQWLDSEGLRVDIRAEFEDGALLNTFGRQGLGLFPASAFDAADIAETFAAGLIGHVPGVFEHYYAITHARKLQHVGVEAVLASAMPEQGAS
ncbi:LysR family transcriptional regulator [Paludibacterium paludis]|uniref:Transcriptional activator NhaR n=1 Tax=Paludibacterium paludis TaxID=1225769 RepID=A0A918P1C3_9NEIS|nr:LysR family transcriptional regulator [Paludibacterium paludis]GGY11970.1 transcriptional activator NhaR [Paludibacterium paludis]